MLLTTWLHNSCYGTGCLFELVIMKGVIYVCRYFNVVCFLEERRGVWTFQRMAGCDVFNRLIDDLSLIDLPLVDRRFTWFRGDGKSMSQLDNFLYQRRDD